MNENVYKEIYEYSEQEIEQCLFELFNILNSKYVNEDKGDIFDIVGTVVYDIMTNGEDYYTSLPKVN